MWTSVRKQCTGRGTVEPIVAAAGCSRQTHTGREEIQKEKCIVRGIANRRSLGE